MIDLSTTYLGLKLKNPLVASASPLSKKVDHVKRMEEAGIAAVVMYSLFEEQITHESLELDHFLSRNTNSSSEAMSYLPDSGQYSLLPEKYLENIGKLKKAVKIPVIGSLNGVSKGGWVRYARDIQDAGAELRAVLQRAGMVVDDRQFKGLLLASGKAVVQGMAKIIRECDGDFSPDPEADRFPPFVPPKDKEKKSPLAEDVWAAGAKTWSPATREKYRRIFDDFLAQLPSYGLRQTRGDWDLARIAKDHVRAWRDGLLERLKNQATPRTIQREYLGALKAIFSSAVRGERIAENPADDVSVAEAWGKKGQKKRGFHDEEAKPILRAALAPPSPRMSAHRAAAQRWVPWLCAYTGARVNEMTQLRARDVVRADGVWCVSITPEAGTQKMESARLVPLHEHLIALGFVEFTMRFRPNQPLFHAYEIPELDDAPENAEALAEHRRKAADAAETIGGRLATWVRGLGVTAKDVDPNHGWRHRFKTEGRACAMDFNVLDAIQGHAPTSVSAKYGEFAPRIMAPHIAKLPRIVVDD